MAQRRQIAGNRHTKADAQKDRFTGAVFESLVDDMTKGRIPLKRMSMSDPETPGLRVVIRNTGLISFHVQFEAGETRPFLKIGDYPKMKVPEARQVASTIATLADMGIDVTEGLHERLVRELKERGTKWRP